MFDPYSELCSCPLHKFVHQTSYKARAVLQISLWVEGQLRTDFSYKVQDLKTCKCFPAVDYIGGRTTCQSQPIYFEQYYLKIFRVNSTMVCIHRIQSCIYFYKKPNQLPALESSIKTKLITSEFVVQGGTNCMIASRKIVSKYYEFGFCVDREYIVF